MTEDDIIAVAREAAAKHGHTLKTEPSLETREFIVELFRMATTKEREACKAACDTTYYQFIGPEFGEVRYGISACKTALDARSK